MLLEVEPEELNRQYFILYNTQTGYSEPEVAD